MNQFQKDALIQFMGDTESTFIFELTKNCNLDFSLFKKMVICCERVCTDFEQSGLDDFYNQILSLMMIAFEHTLFCIACHYLEDDLYKIKNAKETLTSDSIVYIYDNIRELTQRITKIG